MSDESAEIAALQAQIASLEYARDRAIERFELLVAASGQIAYEYDLKADHLIWSGDTEHILGFPLQSLGTTIAQWEALIHPDDAAEAGRLLEEAQTKVAKYEVEYRFKHIDGGYVWLFDRGFFMANADGTAVRMIGTMQDIDERKRAEEDRLRNQAEIIFAQEATLRELSTPLIPIAEGVVVIPLVGTIDTRRAQLVMETLLEGISQYQAETAILDVTGVSIVDTQVANGLIQAAQAARLLGANVILTGIRAEVAQTLVGLGVNLADFQTRASLKDAISSVLLGAAR